MSPEYTVLPIPGDKTPGDDGWQYGWEVRKDNKAILRATTGGTGPCWNFDFPDADLGQLHVCDLGEFIEALSALQDSEADKLNLDRWT